MNIVLFTPVLERASSIARMTSCVSKELILDGHHVSIVRSEDATFFSELPSDFGTVPIAWTDDDIVNDILKDADLVVYQIGDNFQFHKGCLVWLTRVPGVICLHDFYVANLFNGWMQADVPAAHAVLKRWYGAEAPSAYFAALSKATFIEDTLDSMPMTEWICAMASGVITHSEWGISRVRNACAGPIKVIPLAYHGDLPQYSRVESVASKDDLVNILTIGYVNANKRAESIIKAIGERSLLRENVSYQLVGPIQPHTAYELASLARSLNVRLSIYGEVSTIALQKKLESADIVCCLRWPSLEAASGSAVEAMIHGKAVIVTDTGFYSELPDKCVVKIDPLDEVDSIRRALELLVSDASLRMELGERSYEWAVQTFTARNYAKQIIDMGLMMASVNPVISAARYFTGVLDNWGAAVDMDMSDILKPLQLFK